MLNLNLTYVLLKKIIYPWKTITSMLNLNLTYVLFKIKIKYPWKTRNNSDNDVDYNKNKKLDIINQYCYFQCIKQYDDDSIIIKQIGINTYVITKANNYMP